MTLYRMDGAPDLPPAGPIDTWEQRMAERTRQRRLDHHALNVAAWRVRTVTIKRLTAEAAANLLPPQDETHCGHGTEFWVDDPNPAPGDRLWEPCVCCGNPVESSRSRSSVYIDGELLDTGTGPILHPTLCDDCV